MPKLAKWIAAGLVVLLVPQSVPAQEVFKEISSQRLEDLLKSMDINYTKIDRGKGVTFYDFKKNQGQETFRLTNYNGKDLMIDVNLPKVDLEVVNKWNSFAKFSRAHLLKADKKEEVYLESNLDLAGGVTIDTIKHFINRFDGEFLGWINKQGGGGGGAGDEDIFNNVSPERLETILKNLKIEYKRSQRNTAQYYDFKRNGHTLRFSNFAGSDLMISCNFEQSTLAKINEWNAKRSCARAVQYVDDNGKPFVTLESNLDCVAGTTESIIRNLIEAFDADVKAFEAHLAR